MKRATLAAVEKPREELVRAMRFIGGAAGVTGNSFTRAG